MDIVDKLLRHMRRIVVVKTRSSWLYPYLYISYWHYLFSRNKKTPIAEAIYYTAQPNPGAGIGHQIANWIAGYWWATQFELKFAHYPFSTKEWDSFLGFGEREYSMESLKNDGYMIRKLPLFDEFNNKELLLQRNIINSYKGKKVIFVAEQDQGYKDQVGIIEVVRKKFFSASERQSDSLIYDDNCFNIAIHVRRGDIMTGPTNRNLTKRFLPNTYYFRVLTQALKLNNTNKVSHIYFFSQGSPKDFPEFNSFPNLHWCFNMSPRQSFLHMVYADLLIASKSGFSYMPALICKGIKVCPQDFWHGYPNEKDWIFIGDNGNLLKKNS